MIFRGTDTAGSVLVEQVEFDEFPLDRVGTEVNLTGVVYEDRGSIYVLPLPATADRGFEKNVHQVLLDREDWEALIRQSDLVETEVLAQGKDGKLYKALVRKCARQISTNVSWAVYRRDGYACRYCGADDVPLTVDHLVLWESGGPSTEANLVASCKLCNNIRGNMEYEEWLQSHRYLKLSRALTPAQREANVSLIATLPHIERRYHKGKRR